MLKELGVGYGLCKLHRRSDQGTAHFNVAIAQYREQTVGSLSSAMCCSMFMQIYAVYGDRALD